MMYLSPPYSSVVRFSHLCKISFVKTFKTWLYHWRKSEIHSRWQRSSPAAWLLWIPWALPLPPCFPRCLQELLCCRGEQTHSLDRLWVGLHMPERDRGCGGSPPPLLLYYGLVLDLENISRFRDQTHCFHLKQLDFEYGGTGWKVMHGKSPGLWPFLLQTDLCSQDILTW